MSLFDFIIAWLPRLLLNLIPGGLMGAGVYFLYRAFSGKSDDREHLDAS